MSKASTIGKWGEEIAIDFFASLGYTILVHNYRVRGAEIDLIVENDGMLVFVEVKTRKNANFAAARESVDIFKQKRIIMAARRYISENAWSGACRFDVLEVYGKPGSVPKIEHLPNAFEVLG